MTPIQFENYVNRILTLYGYNSINPRNRIEGRGTSHQIDALGISKVTPVFSYPITILAEAKYYNPTRTIGIEILRNFYGVINDIKQKLPNAFIQPTINGNNYINGTSNIIGVIISTAGFSSFSRNFGYAHGIFMVTIGFLKKKNTPYFGNLDGQTVIVQIPENIVLSIDKSDRRNIQITKIVDEKKIFVKEVNTLNGVLELKKELTYKNEKVKFIENDDEIPQTVNCYLYDIKIEELKTTFRTISQHKITTNTNLLLEIPNNKTYISIEIKNSRE